MQRLSLIFMASVMVVTVSMAQSVQTRYFNDRYTKEDVPQKRARYSETVENFQDGSVATTTTNLKKNEVESREVWKGDEPVGKWVGLTGRGPQEMDFDFPLIYTREGCPSDGSISSIKDFFVDNATFNYVAPKLANGENHMDILRKNLRYPAKARRGGIQGTVELIVTIGEDGKVADVKVGDGVEKHMDKEAARVIRMFSFSSPPMLDGQPKRVCMKLPIRFKLN